MGNLDWSKFTRKINISADQKVIFDSWTKQCNIEKWFLKDAIFFTNGKQKDKAEYIAVGDTYQWTWHASDHLAEGEVLEVVASKNLKFTFLGCVVEVEIIEEGGEQVLKLEQSEIALDEESRMNYYVECTRGWTFYMANLKSILEGGIDLRNKSDLLAGVINT